MSDTPNVQAQIAAVTASAGLSALAAFATAAAANTSALPSGMLIAAEDLAAALDPELIPLIAGIQLVMPYVSDALQLLANGTAATGGIVRGRRGGAEES